MIIRCGALAWRLARLRPLATILFVLAGSRRDHPWYLTPKAEYLPEGEESKIFTLMFAPPGYNIRHDARCIPRGRSSDFVAGGGSGPGSCSRRGETDVPGLNFTIGFAELRAARISWFARRPTAVRPRR